MIILIENQHSQFEVIQKYLNDSGYSVFPQIKNEDISEFKEFLDLVRIYLNPRYGGIQKGSRRKFVFDKIVEIIKGKETEIIIIDHKLVGHHKAENGIALALKLRNEGIKDPIMFLSRTEYNMVVVMDNYPSVDEPKAWIQKGYAGEDILDPEYFNNEVILRMQELISQNTVTSISSLMEYIHKHLSAFPAFFNSEFTGIEELKIKISSMKTENIQYFKDKRAFLTKLCEEIKEIDIDNPINKQKANLIIQKLKDI